MENIEQINQNTNDQDLLKNETIENIVPSEENLLPTENKKPRSKAVKKEKTDIESKQINEETLSVEEEKMFENLSKEEIVLQIEKLVQNEDVSIIKKEIGLLKIAFLKKIKEEKKSDETENAENEEQTTKIVDVLEQRFNEAFGIYKNNKYKTEAETEKQKHKNLNAKLDLLDELRKIVDNDEEFKNFEVVKSIQDKWKDIGMVPQSEKNNLWQSYNFLIEKFFDKIRMNKELKNLDLKKNYELKLALCEKVEELENEPNINIAYKKLRQFHTDWREIGQIPNEKNDEIWERFRAATEKINVRKREQIKELRKEQLENLELKAKLCEKVEKISSIKYDTLKQWQNKSNEIDDIQKEWRKIGRVPQTNNDSIWKQFNDAISLFFKNKKEFFEGLKGDYDENYKLKEKLCEKAENLQDSTEWRNTTESIIKLQKDWKNIGPTSKSLSDPIWNRFRKACDTFFNRKKEYFDNVGEHETENLKKKEELLNSLKKHEFVENASENISIINDYQKQWNEIGNIPIKDRPKINQQFKDTINKLFEELKLNKVDFDNSNFKSKIDEMKSNPRGKDIMDEERRKMKIKMTNLQNDINVWENNLGFFSKSKNADSIIDKFKKQIEDAKVELKTLQEKINQINDFFKNSRR